MAASAIREKRLSRGSAGAGATTVQAISQTGSRRSASLVLWSPAPGTILTDGHKAPYSPRSSRPANPLAIIIPSYAAPSSSVLGAAKQLLYSPAAFLSDGSSPAPIPSQIERTSLFTAP